MKPAAVLFIFLFFCVCYENVFADVVCLKNGRRLEGVIIQETPESIEVAVGIGLMKLSRRNVKEIIYSSPAQRREMQKFWERERQSKAAELKNPSGKKDNISKEAPIECQGDHIFVNALLNGKTEVKLLVDTGSSFVVLPRSFAVKLDILANSIKPDVKLTLADGREVTAAVTTLDTMAIGEMVAKKVDIALIYKDDAFVGFDGLLGMSFLKLFKFEINPDKKKIILQSS
ncbi:MAG: retropepsin-like aspartic protease [Candidatus Omnitrophota bacterium]